MNCKNCGAELHDGDFFCTQCGAKNDIPTPTETRELPPSFYKAVKFRRIVNRIALVIIAISFLSKLIGSFIE